MSFKLNLTILRLLLIVGVSVLAGCMSAGGPSQVPVVEVDSSTDAGPTVSGPQEIETPAAIKPAPKPRASGQNAAVVALMGTAQQQMNEGEYIASASTLERAIRISPRDPYLYYQLAQVRFKQQHYRQAEQLCRKAIALAAGNPTLQQRSRALMAQVTEAAKS